MERSGRSDVTYNGRKVSPPWSLGRTRMAPIGAKTHVGIVRARPRGKGPISSSKSRPTVCDDALLPAAAPIATLGHWQTPSGAFLVAGVRPEACTSIRSSCWRNSRAMLPTILSGYPAGPTYLDCLSRQTRPGVPVRALRNRNTGASAHDRAPLVTRCRPGRGDPGGRHRARRAHPEAGIFSGWRLLHAPGHWRAHRESRRRGISITPREAAHGIGEIETCFAMDVDGRFAGPRRSARRFPRPMKLWRCTTSASLRRLSTAGRR